MHHPSPPSRLPRRDDTQRDTAQASAADHHAAAPAGHVLHEATSMGWLGRVGCWVGCFGGFWAWTSIRSEPTGTKKPDSTSVEEARQPPAVGAVGARQHVPRVVGRLRRSEVHGTVRRIQREDRLWHGPGILGRARLKSSWLKSSWLRGGAGCPIRGISRSQKPI